MRVLVVGAGVAGLRVADLLLLSSRDEESGRGERHSVVLLEASPVPGGRVRSVYDEEGRLSYESGPWRIPDSHERAKRLFARFSTLVPLRSPTLASPPGSDRPVVPGLSLWSVSALLTSSVQRADEADASTGYAGQTRAASGSSPYTTGATRFWVVEEGFSSVVSKLGESVQTRGAVVRYDHRVVDVRREGMRFRVLVRRRDGHNAFSDVEEEADVVFVCVPPGVCRGWTSLQTGRSVLSSVEEGQLHHVYARLPSLCGLGPFHARHADSLAGQAISSQYRGSDWVQISYSSGRVASLWRDLSYSHASYFVERVVEEGLRLIRRCLSPLQVVVWATLWGGRGRVGWKGTQVRSHHWERAYHEWRPVPHFDMQEWTRRSVRPTAEAGLYLAGEALSSFQAWMEGSLQTAELAVEAMREDEDEKKRRGGAETRVSKEEGKEDDSSSLHVFVHGRRVDVEEGGWLLSHPGGRGVFEEHNGEDVTELMEHIGHSDVAWAVVRSFSR